MAVQYDSDEERRLHFSAIHSLADQYHLDESMIREIYENELEKLMYSARVKTYLSVLAVRQVKNQLHETLRGPSVGMQHEHGHEHSY